MSPQRTRHAGESSSMWHVLRARAWPSKWCGDNPRRSTCVWWPGAGRASRAASSDSQTPDRVESSYARTVRLVVWLALTVAVATAHAERWPVRAYTTADGLANDRVDN